MGERTYNEAPPPMSEFTAVALGSRIIIFGGWSLDNRPKGEILVLWTNLNVWNVGGKGVVCDNHTYSPPEHCRAPVPGSSLRTWHPEDEAIDSVEHGLMHHDARLGDDILCTLNDRISCATLERAMALVNASIARHIAEHSQASFAAPVEIILHSSAELVQVEDVLEYPLRLRAAWWSERTYRFAPKTERVSRGDGVEMYADVVCRFPVSNQLPCIRHHSSNGLLELSLENLRLRGEEVSSFLWLRQSQALLRHVIIEDFVGLLGAGVRATEGSLLLEHSVIRRNTARARGGALLVEGGEAWVRHSVLSENTALEGGGGIYSSFARVVVEDSVFANNSVTAFNWSMARAGEEGRRDDEDFFPSQTRGGAGIFCAGDLAMRVIRTSFAHNAVTQSDAVDDEHLAGGGIRSQSCPVYLETVDMIGNTAGMGGGVFLESSAALFTVELRLLGNTARLSGGGLSSRSTDAHLFLGGCAEGNVATSGVGGGLLLANPSSTVYMRGMRLQHNQALNHSTELFSSSTTPSGNGGGMALIASLVSIARKQTPPLVLRDAFVTNNTASVGGGGLFLAGFLSRPLVIPPPMNTSSSHTSTEFGSFASFDLAAANVIREGVRQLGECLPPVSCHQLRAGEFTGNRGVYGPQVASEARALVHSAATIPALNPASPGRVMRVTLSILDAFSQPVSAGPESTLPVTFWSEVWIGGERDKGADRLFVRRLNAGTVDLEGEEDLPFEISPVGTANISGSVELSTDMTLYRTLTLLLNASASPYEVRLSGSGDHCRPGQHVSTNRRQCVLCNAGKFSTQNNSLSCEDCPAGRYVSDPGASQCQPCAAGEFSYPGFRECQPCPKGTFSAARGSRCDQCPPGEGVTCLGGTLVLRDGFWIHPHYVDINASVDFLLTSLGGRAVNLTTTLSLDPEDLSSWRLMVRDSLDLAPDVFVGASVAQMLGLESSSSILPCPGEDSCRLTADVGVLDCAEGHTGPFCAVCEEGFAASSPGQCNACGPRSWTAFLSILRLVLIIGLVMVMVRMRLRRKNARSFSKTVLRICLNYSQTASILSSLEVRMTTLVSSLFSYVDLFHGLSLTSQTSRCAFGIPFYLRTIIYVSIPIAALVLPPIVVVTVHGFRRLRRHCRKSGRSQEKMLGRSEQKSREKKKRRKKKTPVQELRDVCGPAHPACGDLRLDIPSNEESSFGGLSSPDSKEGVEGESPTSPITSPVVSIPWTNECKPFREVGVMPASLALQLDSKFLTNASRAGRARAMTTAADRVTRATRRPPNASPTSVTSRDSASPSSFRSGTRTRAQTRSRSRSSSYDCEDDTPRRAALPYDVKASLGTTATMTLAGNRLSRFSRVARITIVAILFLILSSIIRNLLEVFNVYEVAIDVKGEKVKILFSSFGWNLE